MNTHYLIDFENVHDDWPSAVPNLQETDVVYILYTSNARKISLDTIENLYAGLKVIKVAAGKQSLDMHLVSYLGWLINQYGKDATYVVVSGDNGFDGVIRFWGNRGFNVKRRTLPKNARTQAVTAEPKQEEQIVANDEAADTETHSEASAELSESAEKALPEPPAEEITSAEQKAAAPAAAEKKKRNTCSGGKTQTKKKPETEKENPESADGSDPAAAAAPTANGKRDHSKARTDLNNKITVILAKATDVVDPKQIGEITSLVMKQADKENRKSVIYKAMLQKYGQKTGLSYYRLIKSAL